MSDHQQNEHQQPEQQQEEQSQQIAIQDIQLQLQVYELQSEQKLKKLKELFDEKGSVDPSKMFYQDRSSLQVKFQNIIGDLKQFLIKQEVAATEKLRRVFFRILDSPMLLLFKVSRFQIFQIRFDGFDIQLQPMQAIQQLAESIYKNIEDYLTLFKDLELRIQQRQNTEVIVPEQGIKSSNNISQGQIVNKQFRSYQQFLTEASLISLRDKIFILYSYLRKGANILKKKFENKVKIAEIFNQIDNKLTRNLIQASQWKVLKQLSILNYQLYLMQNGFDVLCFYLKIPMVKGAQQIFKEIQIIASKAKQNSNFDSFILIFVKHHREIIQKIRHQGIQQCYYGYVESILMSILELWGCRLCFYKQFTILFECLFELYKPHHKGLEICLKHTPKLDKDDIVLLRTNFKLDLQQKHNQLLSLMTKRTLQEINRFLSELYHKKLYTLNFRDLSMQNGQKESSLNIIVNLLTLLNGNSSYEEFFKIFERSFRQWNHTIDIQHGHKLIPGEFSYPEVGQVSSQETISDSIKIIRNFCVLEDMSFNKQYEALIKGGSNIARTFIQFIQYLSKAAIEKNEKVLRILNQRETQTMIIEILNFLIRCGCSTSSSNLSGSQNQSEKICDVFAKMIFFMKEKEDKVKLSTSIKQIIKKHYENIHITKCIEIFKFLQEAYSEQKSSNIQLIDIMMLGMAKINNLFSYFRFFDMKIDSVQANTSITESQANFLTKQTIIKDGLIQPKNLGIFKLSEFQIVTNPIQFDKILDNIFFTLDSNSKRFIQFLVQQWTKEKDIKQTQGKNFYSNCIVSLLKQYPISIPLFCCTRVQKDEGQNKKDQYSLRCIELACHRLGQQNDDVLNILKSIVSTRSVRYMNGVSYIKQEINPMVMKQLIKILNKLSQQVDQKDQRKIVQICELLAYVMKHSSLDSLKLDTISKITHKVKFFIYNYSGDRNCFSSSSLERLSASYFKIVSIFFQKKEKDMRMPQGSLNFDNFLWSQIRSYNPSISSQKKRPQKMQDTIITDQTIVSPFSISREYNFQTFKISKINQALEQPKNQNKGIKISQIIQKLDKMTEKTTFGSTFSSNFQGQKQKQVNLVNLKYNLRFHLGEENIRTLQRKENMRISQQNKATTQPLETKKNEQNISIIQYYLKELQIPIVSNCVVLDCIVKLLESERQIDDESLYLWVNCRNYETIFINLISIYEYAGFIIKKEKSKVEIGNGSGNGIKEKNSLISRIETKIIQNPQEVLRKILKFLGKIGYSDVWCENNKKFEGRLFPQLQQLFNSMKFTISNEVQYLALLLKTSLENDNLQRQISQSLDNFLFRLFTTRPSSQTSLMYKVSIDRELLNLIMKSLSIKNLNEISFLIHSNFNNLRLYTDQLHEGLKALNMASKNRSYNQYIQISGKEYEDQEFTGPMKLFKQNFKFWIRIEKQGYSFKREEQIKLTLQRLGNAFRKEESSTLLEDTTKIMDQFFSQIKKLQTNIANRVKAFYLVTKLRDLSYQNANTIGSLNSVLKKHAFTTDQILQAIDRIQLFTLMNTLLKQLVQFDRDWSDFSVYEGSKGLSSGTLYTQMDDFFIQSTVTICSTRRFSHSMSKVYESCDLQFDQVLQRCYDSMKLFFTTNQGKQFIKRNQNLLFPAFLTRSFIDDCGVSARFCQRIRSGLIDASKNSNSQQKYQIQIKSNENLISQLLKGFRNAPRETFYNPNKIGISVSGKESSIQQVLEDVKDHMLRNQTLQITKESSYLIFNRYKTSEATLEQIETLGYIIAYCVFNKVLINLPLHPSITAALSFNISNIDDLLSIQFKVWEELKSVLSCSDSKTLNLNFSHIFNSLKTLQDQRVQLIDKGSSKKVNNFNRDEYADLVACYLFYKNCQPQIFRLLKTFITIVPKDYVSCLRIGEIHKLFYSKKNPSQLKTISKNLSEKIGIVLPEVIIGQKETIQNLKDFQNVNWLTEILLDDKNENERQKYWKQETNLFIVTCIGKTSEIVFENQVSIIRHFQSKEQLQKAIKKSI